MGKNYTKTEYKKQYEGDYTTSYKDARLQRKLNQERRDEYQRASKKIDDKPYINPTAPERTGHVNPAGVGGRVSSVGDVGTNENTQRSYTPPVTNQSSRPSAPPIVKERVQETPPPYTAREERATRVQEKQTVPPPPPKAPQRSRGDLSYIDRASLQHPIVVHGPDKYQDIYTSEIINEADARKRLAYAGYEAKPLSEMKTFVLTGFIALLFPLIGPFFLYLVGSGMKKKELTTMIKDISGRRLTFSMPANEEEMAESAKRGGIYVTLAILFAVIHGYYIFYT